MQFLVRWEGFASKQATWEYANVFEARYPFCIDDKALEKGEVLISVTQYWQKTYRRYFIDIV